jgi:DNA-binding transcriptional LysR family regulator
VSSAEALIDLAIAGAGLAWVCDFMITRAEKAGHLVAVLPDASCAWSPISILTLPARHVMPKVRAFIDFVAAEVARSGAAAA